MFVHPSGYTVSINFLVNNEKIAMGGPVFDGIGIGGGVSGGVYSNPLPRISKSTTGRMPIFFLDCRV